MVQTELPANHKKLNRTLSHLPKRPPVNIQFENISFVVPNENNKTPKTIVKGLNGTFKSGELTAIMGPSGAGKSTLMNILAGYKTSNVSGTIYINGQERNLKTFRKMSCYIMQDDNLSPLLTVRESLRISANLKLGKDVTEQEKKDIIEEVVQVLGLHDCTTTQIQKLSGGQRKRLSIALEMVNNPPVMFFDEPTSGLDSSTCFQCLCLLKSLVEGGRTIISTIHQPSARLFEMFDHLYILTEGQCVYRGTVPGLVPFLSSFGLTCPSYHNPADFVMEVVTGEYGYHVPKLVEAVNEGKCNLYYKAELQNRIKKNSSQVINVNQEAASEDSTQLSSLLENAESTIFVKRNFPASSLTQFWILLKRTTYITFRDKVLTRLRFLSHIIVGVILGFMYYDIGNDAAKVMSNSGCLFFIPMFIMFTSMMPTILTFPIEMSVFIREHLNYWYSVRAYYFAKTIADIPFQVVMTTAYVSGVYYLTSQPRELTRFLMVLLISIQTSLVSQSYGLLVGLIFNLESGVFLGPISLVPTVLFSGFFEKLADIPSYMRWMPYFSYIKYSFEGIMIAIYGLNREKLVCNDEYCHFRYPSRFLEEFALGNSMSTFIFNSVGLFIMFVVLRILTYLLLRLKLQRNR